MLDLWSGVRQFYGHWPSQPQAAWQDAWSSRPQVHKPMSSSHRQVQQAASPSHDTQTPVDTRLLIRQLYISIIISSFVHKLFHNTLSVCSQILFAPWCSTFHTPFNQFKICILIFYDTIYSIVCQRFFSRLAAGWHPQASERPWQSCACCFDEMFC